MTGVGVMTLPFNFVVAVFLVSLELSVSLSDESISLATKPLGALNTKRPPHVLQGISFPYCDVLMLYLVSQ